MDARPGSHLRSQRDGNVRGVDWGFNAWGGLNGGLYFPWDQDELVAGKVLEMEACDRYRAPLIMEGGAFTWMARAQCW